MVMINTVVLPGSDAAVLRLKESGKLIAMTSDCNGRYCYIDPYQGAVMAVSEASRNLIVSGAKPIGLTDCLNFGNPTKPEVFWQFQKAIEGIRDACLRFGIPVTGGNVSFYNESPQGAVYPTPAIGMVGVIENEKDVTTLSFKQEGNLVFLVGGLGSGLGGSEYLWRIKKLQKGPLPKFDFEKELRVQDFMAQVIKEGWIQSAHDISEGGLAVALAECSIPGRLGVECHLPESRLRRDELLFGESPSRVIVSLKPQFKDSFIELSQDARIESVMIGNVKGNRLQILQGTQTVIDCNLEEIEKNWRTSIESLMKKI
jgi:phosphoribosylformylglycinamidine synthase